ncbi:MAG: T9SS type A sorting domain-containing protein [Bacteroidia bacterium]|nr:T9SS type A sorting domain-containing protein [Bacteroidia bacterium]
MGKLYCNLLFFIISPFIFCQSISKSVIGMAGKTLTNGDISISWTAGEPIIGLMTSKLGQLGNGYYPSMDVEALVKNALILAPSNFSIDAKGESCLNKKNGEITISGIKNYNYVASLNGTNYNFVNNKLSVPNLAPGEYDLCITIPDEIFQQCYIITIPKGGSITGRSSVSTNKVTVDISEGTAPFQVLINGKEVLETSSSNFSVDVQAGDLLQVKTALACEGIYAESIDNLLGLITAYPNPTQGKFIVNVPTSNQEVEIDLYTLASQLISRGTYPVVNEKVQLSLENQAVGVYIVKINLATPVSLIIVKN